MLDVNKTNILCVSDAADKTHGTFVCEPLDRGYGTTIGNSLKRILLSSIKGAAITAVRIGGADSMESKMANTKEDAIDIVLNLKKVCINTVGETVKGYIKVEASVDTEVTAADIICEKELSIINPDNYIATVLAGQTLEIELVIQDGYGYVAAEKNVDVEEGMIPVDAIYSPIERVDYVVKNTRVGNTTDYDSLTLDIYTNGSVAPLDAMKLSADIMIDRLNPFLALWDTVVDEPKPINPMQLEQEAAATASKETADLLSNPISDLELGMRSANCMKRAGINTIGDLVAKTSEEVMSMRNLGAKSYKEILDSLAERGLTLKGASKDGSSYL